MNCISRKVISLKSDNWLIFMRSSFSFTLLFFNKTFQTPFGIKKCEKNAETLNLFIFSKKLKIPIVGNLNSSCFCKFYLSGACGLRVCYWLWWNSFLIFHFGRFFEFPFLTLNRFDPHFEEFAWSVEIDSKMENFNNILQELDDTINELTVREKSEKEKAFIFSP